MDRPFLTLKNLLKYQRNAQKVKVTQEFFCGGTAASGSAGRGRAADTRSFGEQRALPLIARQRGGAFELRARFGEPTQLVQKVAAHARQQMIRAQRRLPQQAIDDRESR